MDQLTTRFDADAHAAEIREQGFTVIRDFIGPETIAAVREGLAPYQDSHHGRNDFEGFKTERVYTLVARAKVFQDLAEEPRVLAILDRFLQPDYLLTACQSIRIEPGETAQSIHSDDGFYRQRRPRAPIGYQRDRGDRRLHQGQRRHRDDPRQPPVGRARRRRLARERRRQLESQLVPMEIPAGALVFMPARCCTAAARTSPTSRAWPSPTSTASPGPAAGELLALGPARAGAARCRRALQTLLGYDIWPPFMGMVTGSHPAQGAGAGLGPASGGATAA
jgi:hypothetical protein